MPSVYAKLSTVVTWLQIIDNYECTVILITCSTLICIPRLSTDRCCQKIKAREMCSRVMHSVCGCDFVRRRNPARAEGQQIKPNSEQAKFSNKRRQ